jgi:PDZ domain-containing protein
VFVVSVIAGYPADGKLVAEDVILAVNGQRVDSPEALGQAIQANGAGTPLGLTVQRMVEVDGTLQRRTSRVTVTPTIPKNSNRAQIGVEAITNFPVPLYINNEGIGGPSAGLMWTLGLIDWLTPGDLTRGRLIAGTGTILPDGTVGGVVFAEANTNPDVGYALTPTEVAVAIRPGVGRTSAVDTGACIVLP